MPKLLLLPPLLIDHTFPHNEEELEIVSYSLSSVISDYLNTKKIILLIPESFDLFMEFYEWDNCGSIQSQIYLILRDIVTTPTENIIKISLEKVVDNYHEFPNCTNNSHNVDIWCHDIGKLYYVHTVAADDKGAFIGIICPYAFSNKNCEHKCHIKPQKGNFPYINNTNLYSLEEPDYYEIPVEFYNKDVSFVDAKKNIHLLGGTVRKKTGSSHYPVSFPNARTWILDSNDDPVPQKYINNLAKNLKIDPGLINYVLITGGYPPKLLKLDPERDVFKKSNIEIAIQEY